MPFSENVVFSGFGIGSCTLLGFNHYFFLFIVLSGWDVIPFFLFDVSDITSVVLIIVMCLICDLGCVLYQLDVKNSRQKGELGCERLRANAVVFRQLTF